MDSIATYNSIALPDSAVTEGQSDLSVLLQQSIDSATAVLQPLNVQLGKVGEPIPYTITDDSLVNVVLLGSLLLFIVTLAKSLPFIIKQAKHFFQSANDDNDISETSGELNIQFSMALLDCLLIGIVVYYYASHLFHFTLTSGSHAPIIAIFAGAFAVYFLLKVIAYTVVNLTLFDSKRNIRLLKALAFVMALQALLLFPVVLLQVYIGIEQRFVTFFCIFLFIFSKFLTFYKCWDIFFHRKSAYLQTFLYLCTLEIAPLLTMSGIMVLLANAIKVKF